MVVMESGNSGRKLVRRGCFSTTLRLDTFMRQHGSRMSCEGDLLFRMGATLYGAW
jgi:hypothetical protein